MAGKFEVFVGKNGKHYFRLKASNGETILSGQGYKARASCLKGIESIKANAAREGAFEEKKNTRGQHYLVIKATNGRVIATSESYKSRSSCTNCVKSVKKNAPTAKVVDAT